MISLITTGACGGGDPFAPHYTLSEVSAMTCRDFVDAGAGGQGDMVRVVLGKRIENHPALTPVDKVAIRVNSACYGEESLRGWADLPG